MSSSRDLKQAASGASLPAHTPGPWELREYGSPRGTYFVDAGPTRILSSMKCGEANARLIAEAPSLVEDGWRLAISALQSDRYGKDPDFRDAVDDMLDTCRRAKGERTFAETQAAKALGADPKAGA